MGVSEIDGILSRFRRHKEAKRRNAGWPEDDFNLFSVLGLADWEDAHSRVLYSLLQPNGAHGQGDRFLKSFLVSVARVNTENLSKGQWMVAREKDVSEGRIDLLIWNLYLSQYIALENKINAADQPRQLDRYYQSLTGRGSVTLLYLTRHGTPPKEKPTGEAAM